MKILPSYIKICLKQSKLVLSDILISSLPWKHPVSMHYKSWSIWHSNEQDCFRKTENFHQCWLHRCTQNSTIWHIHSAHCLTPPTYNRKLHPDFILKEEGYCIRKLHHKQDQIFLGTSLPRRQYRTQNWLSRVLLWTPTEWPQVLSHEFLNGLCTQ